MNYKLLYLKGFLYSFIAIGTPIAGYLSSNSPITVRAMTAVIIGALISGATAAKAFLSTSFANRDSANGNGAV